MAAAAPETKIGVFSGPFGGATGANGYNIYLSCSWPESARKDADEVALVVSFMHIDSVSKFSADVCRGIRVAIARQSSRRILHLIPNTRSAGSSQTCPDWLMRFKKPSSEGIHITKIDPAVVANDLRT